MATRSRALPTPRFVLVHKDVSVRLQLVSGYFQFMGWLGFAGIAAAVIVTVLGVHDSLTPMGEDLKGTFERLLTWGMLAYTGHELRHRRRSALLPGVSALLAPWIRGWIAYVPMWLAVIHGVALIFLISVWRELTPRPGGSRWRLW